MVDRINDKLHQQPLAVVQAISNGQCLAQSFYIQGHKVCGPDLEQLLLATGQE